MPQVTAPKAKANTVVEADTPTIKGSADNTAEVTNALKVRTNTLQTRRRALKQEYMAEEKVQVVGAPAYRPYFGRNMPLSINGIAVYVPLDGNPYNIPKTFASLFYERLSKVDRMQQMSEGLSDPINVCEAYAGEKDLITRL